MFLHRRVEWRPQRRRGRTPARTQTGRSFRRRYPLGQLEDARRIQPRRDLFLSEPDKAGAPMPGFQHGPAVPSASLRSISGITRVLPSRPGFGAGLPALAGAARTGATSAGQTDAVSVRAAKRAWRRERPEPSLVQGRGSRTSKATAPDRLSRLRRGRRLSVAGMPRSDHTLHGEPECVCLLRLAGGAGFRAGTDRWCPP